VIAVVLSQFYDAEAYLVFTGYFDSAVLTLQEYHLSVVLQQCRKYTNHTDSGGFQTFLQTFPTSALFILSH